MFLPPCFIHLQHNFTTLLTLHKLFPPAPNHPTKQAVIFPVFVELISPKHFNCAGGFNLFSSGKKKTKKSSEIRTRIFYFTLLEILMNQSMKKFANSNSVNQTNFLGTKMQTSKIFTHTIEIQLNTFSPFSFLIDFLTVSRGSKRKRFLFPIGSQSAHHLKISENRRSYNLSLFHCFP